MTRQSHTYLGHPCCGVPTAACPAVRCTDYSDTLNFSLTAFIRNGCGKLLDIPPSVRLSLFQHWHGLAANGVSCASVRVHSVKCVSLASIQRCCGQLVICSAFNNSKENFND